MSIWRRNKLTAFTCMTQLMKVDARNQILCCDCFMVLRNSDRSCNRKRLLNQRGSDGDYSLYWYIATLFSIGLFTITRCRREVRIEIRVAETPASWCQVEPFVSRWIRKNMACRFKRFIDQVDIRNMRSR